MIINSINKIALTIALVSSSLLASAQGLKLEKAWETETELTTCESVLPDPNGSRYFVSCINASPLDKDSNGFIAVISPDGKIVNKYWGQGLHAPKGMGISGTSLYVTDIDHVAVFNLSNGKRTAYINVPGGKFLNDITVDKKGNVYVTDMNTSIVHKIVGTTLSTFIDAGKFQKPNGLFAKSEGIQLVDGGTGKFYLISYDGKKITDLPLSLPIFGGDGIIDLPQSKNNFIVSAWQGKIYGIENKCPSESKPGKASILLDTEADKVNTADIGFDEVRNLLLVPTFFGNKVVAYKVVGQ